MNYQQPHPLVVEPPIVIKPGAGRGPGLFAFVKRTRQRKAAAIRQRNKREREARGKRLLTITITDDMIGVLVTIGRLTELDVADNRAKVQAEVRKLQAEVEEAAADYLRRLLWLAKNSVTRDGAAIKTHLG